MTDKTLRRRRFLTAIGAIGSTTIAGCSGGGNTPTPTPSPSPTPTPTPTPTTPNEEAVEHYEAAIDKLVQTKETLDEWAESSYEADMVGTLQDRVSEVRDDLDAAEEAADQGSDLLPKINQARLVADFQELTLAYYEGVNVLIQTLQEAKNLGDNELHQRAADAYANAKNLLDDLRKVLEDMGTLLGEIDNEVLGEPELEYTGQPLDHLDLENKAAFDGVESYLDGYENIHLAFVQLEAGQEHYDNEEWSEARKDWETGLEHTKLSKAGFEAAVDNDHTPEDQRQESINLISIVETVMNAFEKFVEGAKEAEDGNLENANSLVKEGFQILGQL